MTGATITGPKGTTRRAGQGALFFKQMLLHFVPTWAAKLGGPTVAQPALGAQNFGPSLHVFTGQAQGVVHFVGNLLGQMRVYPSAYFFTKSLFFRGESQIHRGSPRQFRTVVLFCAIFHPACASPHR